MSPRISLVLLAALVLPLAHRAAESTPALPATVPGFPTGWCIRAKAEVFADAKSAGFEHVELAMQDVLPLSDDDFAKLAAALQATGLRALSGYNSVPKEIMLVGPTADAARQNDHIARVLVRASALKLTYLILNAGASWRVPEGGSREAAAKQLAEFCGRFAAAAAKQNITVLVEPLRNSDTNMITTIAEAVALVKAVDNPNFQMMVDYSFLRIQKDDVNALRQARGHLRNVHIANPDKTPRVYPMDASESDYGPFFAVLKEIGYRGGLSVHAGTGAFATEAPRAIAFLRGQARALAGEAGSK